MNKTTFFSGFIAVFSLCACTNYVTEEVTIQAHQNDLITLQNLQTREIVHCRANYGASVEECAEMFENFGFIRLSDIPQQTANYDIAKPTTYPTRRWREGEQSPRW